MTDSLSGMFAATLLWPVLPLIPFIIVEQPWPVRKARGLSLVGAIWSITGSGKDAAETPPSKIRIFRSLSP